MEDFIEDYSEDEIRQYVSNNALEIAVNEMNNINNHSFIEGKKITISLGVVSYIKNESIESLIKRVVEKLYHSKNSGRNMTNY